MPLPNIIRLFQTIKELQSAQVSLEINSGEITRKTTEQELSILHATHLLDLIYVPTIYYQFTSNSLHKISASREILHYKESDSCLSCT